MFDVLGKTVQVHPLNAANYRHKQIYVGADQLVDPTDCMRKINKAYYHTLDESLCK